jgi:hypothetical protein
MRLFAIGIAVAGCGSRTGLLGPDVTAFSPDDSGTPTPQEQCVAPGSSALVLFGVRNENFTSFSATWEWSGNAWSQRTANGAPGDRAFEGMAPLGCNVVLFGGYAESPSGPTNDTWVWDGTSWTQRNVPGPSARYGTSMAELGNTVLLFGGLDANQTPLGDTWEWDGKQWAQRFVPGPQPRSHYAMASLGDKIVLFGGLPSPGAEPYGDTWEWDGSGWTLLAVNGPPARFNHGMASDGRTVVLFGGDATSVHVSGSPSGSLSDTWIWDGATWVDEGVADPPPRSDPGMAGFRGSVVLYGGFDDGSGQNYADTWQWDGLTWTQLPVTGPPLSSNVMAPR